MTQIITVYLQNMDKTDLVGANGAVNVKLYGVDYLGHMGAEYSPKCVFDGAVAVTNNKLKIRVDNTDEMDVYFTVITSTDTTGEKMRGIKRAELTYEAEEAELLGLVNVASRTRKNAEYAVSRSKLVTVIDKNNEGVKFTVDVPKDGLYDISLFYSLKALYVNSQTLLPDAGGQNRGIGQVLPFRMKVDGKYTSTLFLNTTAKNLFIGRHHIDWNLTEGEHTIEFIHINGNESAKGNLQLTAELDKIDLKYIDNESERYNFSVDLSEMMRFREGNVTEITAVAPLNGYYAISGNGEFSIEKMYVDYAPDAKTGAQCSLQKATVGNIVYISQKTGC